MKWGDVMHFPLITPMVTPIDIWNIITRTDFLIPNLYWVPVFIVALIVFGSRVHRKRVERNRVRREAEKAARQQAEEDRRRAAEAEQAGNYYEEE